MLPIEETLTARPVVSLRVPAAASQEFGEDAIKRAIEEQRTTENTRFVSTIQRQLMVLWRKLFAAAPGALEKAIR